MLNHLKRFAPLAVLITILLVGFPRVHAQTAHGVLVSWTAPTGSDAAVGYFVFRGTSSSGPFTQIDTMQDTTTTYLDATAPTSTTLFYYAVAVDANGNQSAPSNIATVTTPATFPSNPGSPSGCSAKVQ
jgi:fibronectin type 3 domain-containing protein